jgi:hypothetical protein
MKKKEASEMASQETKAKNIWTMDLSHLFDMPPLELSFVADTLKLIDAHLVRLDQQIHEYIEQNQEDMGQAESLVGLGFVALQEFIVFAKGEKKIASKESVLSLQPEIAPGHPLAKVINDAANFFKHRYEWQFQKQADTRQAQTESTFRNLGIDVEPMENPLLNLLRKISDKNPPSFQPVVNLLNVWWDSLVAERKKQDTKP